MIARWVCALLLLSTCAGCSLSLDWLRQYRAQRAIAKQDYAGAVVILRQIMDLSVESEKSLVAARQGARIAHLDAKNYPEAIEFYRVVVLRSEDPLERKSAQQFIAQIYFENLQDFDHAVAEYEKLLKLDVTPQEKFRYRLNLAKCYFQMNNLEQALAELDLLQGLKPTGDDHYDMRTLRANILVAAKQLAPAAEAWESLIRDFPERSNKENVALNLVVCYEELQEFDKAVTVLERMRPSYPNPDFLNLRIERLKEKQANLPGARGWKK